MTRWVQAVGRFLTAAPVMGGLLANLVICPVVLYTALSMAFAPAGMAAFGTALLAPSYLVSGVVVGRLLVGARIQPVVWAACVAPPAWFCGVLLSGFVLRNQPLGWVFVPVFVSAAAGWAARQLAVPTWGDLLGREANRPESDLEVPEHVSAGVTNLKHIGTFEHHVLEVAGAVLRTHHPAFVEAHEAALGPTGKDVAAALAAVEKIPTPRFDPWRRIVECLVDIHMAVTYLETSLRVYNTRLPDSLLDQIGVSVGQWVAMSHNSVYVTLDGLVERTQKLGEAVARTLRVPGATLDVLKKRTDYLHAEIAKARNKIAHGGEAASIRDERYAEVLALLGGIPDGKRVVESYGARHKDWSERAHHHGITVVNEIDEIIRALDEAVDWDALLDEVRGK